MCIAKKFTTLTLRFKAEKNIKNIPLKYFLCLFHELTKGGYMKKLLLHKKGKADKLSKKETEILELLTCGFENKAISAKLNIGIKTVEAGKEHIKEKLGVSSVRELYNLKSIN